MNLPNFLRKIDAAIATLSKKQLEDFVHDFARKLPEHQRVDFLEKLNAVNGMLDSSCVEKAKRQEEDDLKTELETLKNKLLKIQREELCLTSEINEEYDDWYNNDVDEFFFADSEDILPTIENACKILHRCIDEEYYQEGENLAKQLLELTVFTEGDYSDYIDDSINIWELEEKDLITCDLKQLILDGMYAAYQVFPLSKKPEALYQILCDANVHDVTLEDLMQYGDRELPQQDEFLDAWILFLGGQQGLPAKRLMREAILLENDFTKAQKYAHTFSGNHPEIYEQILLHLTDNTEQGHKENDALIISVGQEALSNIQPQYLVRSEIALSTASAALRMKKQDLAEFCWAEAFYSKTNLTNYLRLISEGSQSEEYKEKARNFYHSFYQNANQKTKQMYSPCDADTNHISTTDYDLFTFFDTQFQQILDNAVNVKEALGWSGSFMKEGIALFLLLLFQGKELPIGCQKMCSLLVNRSGFSAEEYEKGLISPIKMKDTELFWNLFYHWKKEVHLTLEEQNKILEKLSAWIEMRVEGIMQNNRRNYYGECAAFIAALGEAKESLGENNGKARTMEAYRAKYPRRSAFHREMQIFGFKKKRK